MSHLPCLHACIDWFLNSTAVGFWAAPRVLMMTLLQESIVTCLYACFDLCRCNAAFGFELHPPKDLTLSAALQKLSSLQHQMRMLDGRIWEFGPDKPYHNMTDFWDGEVPEANLK